MTKGPTKHFFSLISFPLRQKIILFKSSLSPEIPLGTPSDPYVCMEAIINGRFLKVNLYNTDFCDSYGNNRMDGIEMDLECPFRGEYINGIYLYPEDAENLVKALKHVLRDAVDFREKLKLPTPPPEDTTILILEEESEVYQVYMREKDKELEGLFGSGEWFGIERNDVGVADTWGTAEVLYKKYMPFLVWNSETGRPEFVDEGWRETGLHHDISWLPKYTKMKGII